MFLVENKGYTDKDFTEEPKSTQDNRSISANVRFSNN